MKNIKEQCYIRMPFWNNVNILFYQKLLILSLSFVGLISCSPNFQSTIISLSKNKFEQTDLANVKIYVSEKPKDAYTEICLIRVPIFRKKQYGLDNLKTVASQQGADAVIDVELNDNFISGVAVKWR